MPFAIAETRRFLRFRPARPVLLARRSGRRNDLERTFRRIEFRPRAVRHDDLLRHVADGRARHARYADPYRLAFQAAFDAPPFRFLAVIEFSKHESADLIQNAREPQVREHAVDP